MPEHRFQIPHGGDEAEFLFHYTNSAGLAGILDSGVFRLSDLGRLNDPRENRPFNLDIKNIAPGDLEGHEQSAEVIRRLREETRVGCFTIERGGLGLDGNYQRGWGRARNWSHYADNHRGAVLVLNRKRFVADVHEVSGAKCVAAPVTYADGQIRQLDEDEWWSPDAEGRNIDETVEWLKAERAGQLFFRKNRDWETEHEYRVLVWDSAYAHIPVSESIEAVIVGEKYPQEDFRVLAIRLARLGIRALHVAQMVWQEGALMPLSVVERGDLIGFDQVDEFSDGWPRVSPQIS